MSETSNLLFSFDRYSVNHALRGFAGNTYCYVLSHAFLDIGHKKAILVIGDQMEAVMFSGTNTNSMGKFGTFVVRRFPQLENAPLSHGSKVVLWVGLAVASWAVVILAGYFVWSAL